MKTTSTGLKKERKPTGPPPERIKIESAWEKAVSKALKKKRPSQGWPEEEKK